MVHRSELSIQTSTAHVGIYGRFRVADSLRVSDSNSPEIAFSHANSRRSVSAARIGFVLGARRGHKSNDDHLQLRAELRSSTASEKQT